MAMMVICLGCGLGIAVFRSSGPVAEFACDGVSRAVSVLVHTLASPSNRDDLGMTPSMLYRRGTRVPLHSTICST